MRTTRQFGFDLPVNVDLSLGKNDKKNFRKTEPFNENSDPHTVQKQVEEEISRQKEVMAATFEKEMEKYKKELNAKLEKQLAANAETQAKLISLLNDCQKEYDNKRKSDILQMKPTLVLWVTEAIYKTCAKKIVVDTVIDNVIEMLLEKYANEPSTKLSISVSDFQLLESNPIFEKVRALIHPDASLHVGQARLEDNISVQTIGIIDRLDELRVSFVAALEANDEV